MNLPLLALVHRRELEDVSDRIGTNVVCAVDREPVPTSALCVRTEPVDSEVSTNVFTHKELLYLLAPPKRGCGLVVSQVAAAHWRISSVSQRRERSAPVGRVCDAVGRLGFITPTGLGVYGGVVIDGVTIGVA